MKWQPFFNFFIMANADIPFPLTLVKLETQTLGGGVSNLKFFCMIDINKMAAIFNFFIMVDADILFPSTLRKTGSPNFGGVGNLTFFCMIDINEMAAIFQFVHNGQC